MHVSKAWLKASGALAFASVLLLFTGLVDYVGLIAHSGEHQRLVNENHELKDSTATMERRLSLVTQELDRVHKMTTKLKAITALVGDTSAATSAGIVESEDASDGRSPSAVDISIPILGMNASSSAGHEEFGAWARNLLARLFATETIKDDLTLPEKIDLTLQDSRLREQELMTTWGALSDRQSLLAAMPSIKPAHGYFSSPFGYRFDPINGRPLLHAGVDIAAPWGTQVLAPGDGVVSYVGYEGGYGNLVAIDHGYGVTTRFAHNSRIFVRQGQRVRRWEPISAVGSTGHSTGAHVHYEVRVHGLPVDPVNYILQDN